MSDARQTTERLLEMVEQGALDRDYLIMACLKYMSEDEVRDVAHVNEIIIDENGTA